MAQRHTGVIVGSTILTIAVLTGAYVFTGPYLALRGIEAALNARDAEALNQYVDFPALQQDLTTQLEGATIRSAATELKDNPFGLLGVAMVHAIIEPMVKAFVSPAGVAAMLTGAKPDIATAQPTGLGEGNFHFPTGTSSRFDGLDRFVVTIPSLNSDQRAVRVILRREGLSWKLTSIQVPSFLEQAIPSTTQARTAQNAKNEPKKARAPVAADAAKRDTRNTQGKPKVTAGPKSSLSDSGQNTASVLSADQSSSVIPGTSTAPDPSTIVASLSPPPDAPPPATVAPPPPTPATPTTSHAVTADDYPPASIRLQEQGKVAIKYTIGTYGSVIECAVTMTSGKPRLDDAACPMVLKHWKFKPATQDGNPVAVSLPAEIIFALK